VVWKDYTTIEAEIQHFFNNYKSREPPQNATAPLTKEIKYNEKHEKNFSVYAFVVYCIYYIDLQM